MKAPYLRTHDGLVALGKFDHLRVVHRAGYTLLTGEIASQMVDHVLCWLAPWNEDIHGGRGDDPTSTWDQLLDMLVRGMRGSDAPPWMLHGVLDVRKWTILATEEMQEKLAQMSREAMEAIQPKEELAAPVERTKRRALRFQLDPGTSIQEINSLTGKTIDVDEVQISGRVVALIIKE